MPLYAITTQAGTLGPEAKADLAARPTALQRATGAPAILPLTPIATPQSRIWRSRRWAQASRTKT